MQLGTRIVGGVASDRRLLRGIKTNLSADYDVSQRVAAFVARWNVHWRARNLCVVICCYRKSVGKWDCVEDGRRWAVTTEANRQR